MNNLKFRAFDKEANVMVYSDEQNKEEYQIYYYFNFNKDGNVVCNWQEDYDDSCGYSRANGGELDNIMQYTGLRDKNGREIYKGDILKEYISPWSNEEQGDNYGVVKCHKNYLELYLEWNFARGYQGEKYWDNNRLPLSHAKEYVVVGNIYQNEGLLKK